MKSLQDEANAKNTLTILKWNEMFFFRKQVLDQELISNLRLPVG